MKLSRVLDRLPKLVPARVAPLVKPVYPVYIKLLDGFYRVFPERQETTVWGFKMMVDPSNNIERKMSNGLFEQEIIEYFIDEFGGETGHFVDVGANIGLYSLLYATHSNGRVDAFEPLPSNLNRLRRNIKINEYNIHIHEFGLGREPTTASLAVNPENPAEASLSSTTMHGGESMTVDIEIRPYSEISETTPDVMKVDVEGGEYDAIHGAKEALEGSLPELFLEIHPKLLREFGYSVDDFVFLLQDIGYTNFFYIEGRTSVSPQAIQDISDRYGFHIHAT